MFCPSSLWKALAVFVLAVGFGVAPISDAQAKDDSITLSATAAPASVRAGEHFVLSLHAKIPASYHLYPLTKVEGGPLPLKIQIDAKGIEQQGVWHAPKPKVELDKNFGKNVEYWADAVTHQGTFLVSANAAGAIPVNVVMRGQICNESRCIPFKQKTALNLTVEPGPARDQHKAAPTLQGEAFTADRSPPEQPGGAMAGGQQRKKLGEDGLFSFILVALLAGFAALVTPCVFPMIPITVSFFSKFSKVSMRRSVTMGSIYAVSIVGTFTVLGMLVSLIFGAVGMQNLSTSPIFNLFMAALLIVFAYNLFGLFEITVPSWLISKSSEKEHQLKDQDGNLSSQALGVFFMGLTFTLVSFTCTVGFIGMVLAEAAKGNWFYPAIGMFAFSLSFSLPFFFLAVFPSWADKLKGKAGDWMIAVKVTLGFLELAGAFKFLSNVDLIWKMETVTRPLVLALWAAIFLAAALYLFRIIVLPHGNPEDREIGPIRMSFGMVMVALSIYSASGISHTRSLGGWMDGWLPPAVYPGQEGMVESGDSGHLPFMKDDIPGAMAKARERNVPVFIDFTGYACTNCRYMEGSMFPRPNIRSRLEKMVLASAYTDCEEAVCEEQRDMQLERFDTAALPFYVVIDPHTDTVLATFADMTRDPKEYENFLQLGLDKFDAVKPKTAAPAGGDEAHAKADDGHDEVSVKLATSGKVVDFEFPRLDNGRKVKLSKFRGEWVFLNFWASWCGPCKEEIEHEFPEALATAPHVKYMTIAWDGEESRQESLKFAKKVGLLKDIALIGGEDIEEAGLAPEFKADPALPISYLIHPKGHIAWSHHGALHKESMKALLAQTK